jgi:hypothetical protein
MRRALALAAIGTLALALGLAATSGGKPQRARDVLPDRACG